MNILLIFKSAIKLMKQKKMSKSFRGQKSRKEKNISEFFFSLYFSRMHFSCFAFYFYAVFVYFKTMKIARKMRAREENYSGKFFEENLEDFLELKNISPKILCKNYVRLISDILHLPCNHRCGRGGRGRQLHLHKVQRMLLWR